MGARNEGFMDALSAGHLAVAIGIPMGRASANKKATFGLWGHDRFLVPAQRAPVRNSGVMRTE